MRKIKKTVNFWITCDGEKFEDEQKARAHEAIVKVKKRLEIIKQIIFSNYPNLKESSTAYKLNRKNDKNQVLRDRYISDMIESFGELCYVGDTDMMDLDDMCSLLNEVIFNIPEDVLNQMFQKIRETV